MWAPLAVGGGRAVLYGDRPGARICPGRAHFELREVTRDVDVYFTSMRLNRALNQWNVEVTLSNRTAQPLNGLLVLVVIVSPHFRPAAADGSSAGQSFYDLGAQSAGGRLPAGGQTVLRARWLWGLSPAVHPKSFRGFLLITRRAPALGFVRSLDSLGQPLPGVSVEETWPGRGERKRPKNSSTRDTRAIARRLCLEVPSGRAFAGLAAGGPAVELG